MRENLLHDIRYVAEASVVDEAIQACGLAEKSDTLSRSLSEGQRHRIALAKLWLTDAKLWVLDEPFEAIDRNMHRALEARLSAHLSSGGSFVLSTHVPLLDSALARHQLKLGGADAQ